MTLTQADYRRVHHSTCERCGDERISVWGDIHDDGEPYALFYAFCYPCSGEIWIDVIFGAGDAEHPDDHVTFGCRVGNADGETSPGCSLVNAAPVTPDDPLFGRKLAAAEARAHPWLPYFWEVVDFLLLADPTVRAMYGEIFV